MTQPEPFLLLGEPPSNRTRKTDFKPAPHVQSTGEGHLITVAPTGAGKGVSCIIPALLTWTGPAIVIDPKGENYAVTASYRKSLGQTVHVLDPFGVTDVPIADKLNPLDCLCPGSSDFEDDAVSLARAICSDRSKRDPFWDERAQALITGLIIQAAKTERNSLSFVHDTVQVDEYPFLNRLDAKVCDEFISDRTAKGILTLGAHSTRGGIIATAGSHVSFLKGRQVRTAVEFSTISLDDIRNGKPMTIYIVVPPAKLISHGKLIRLWLTVMMGAIATRRFIPKQQTLFLLDEAAQLGNLDAFRSALTLMRGYGVKVWSFWQDLSQLKRLYEDWETILNNCAYQQYFGANTPHAAKAINELIPLGQGRTSTLPAGQGLLVAPGKPPEIVSLPNYLTSRELAGRADPNPFYEKNTKPSAEVIFLRPHKPDSETER